MKPGPASELAPLPAGRYWLLLLLGCLALPAAWAALVLHSASWAEARALEQLFPYFNFRLRPFTAADWQLYQRGTAGLAGALTLAWLATGPLSAAGRRQLRGTGAELRVLGGALVGRWRALPAGQRRGALLGLGALTAVRAYLGYRLHWADDAVSFEFFVRQRLLAPAAYYPLPNNHVLSNVLDWAFYQLHPGFWWSMRLPVLLTSTAGTVLLGAGLLRRLGYWPALLAAGLMSVVELSLYHAGAGRGYWLVATAAALQFLAVLALQGPPEAGQAATPRVAWLALAGAALVGCYAVPVGVYSLASALSWLAVRAVRARQGRALAAVAGLGAAVGAGLLLLYLPLLLVSGPAALTANTYVLRLGAGQFYRQLPRFAWLMEGQLLGQRHVGALGLLLVLGLFVRLWQRQRRGQLPAALTRAVPAVGGPALWFGAFPYALLLVQRVLPPERTWLYKSWFTFILAALVLAGWSWQRPARRWLLGVGLGLFGGYQLANQLRLDRASWQGRESHRAVEAWLAAHPQARPALVPEVYLWAWFRFNAHIEHPGQPFTAEQQARPGQLYGSIVSGSAQAPPGAGALWYQAGNLRIYHVAPPR